MDRNVRPDPELIRRIDEVWNDESLDDDERATRMSAVNGFTWHTNRADIGDFRAWEARVTPEELARIQRTIDDAEARRARRADG